MTASVRARYFPASVVLPDGRQMRRVYVLLAEGGEHHGLHVYARPDDEVFHAPINWLRTPKLRTGRASRNGVDIHLTDGGIAVITPGAACRCGVLGRWSGPGWAHTIAVGATS
jgi:hypothetical protein